MESGEWLQWRRDSQRSGRVPMSGRINQPVISSEHFLGGREDWLVLQSGTQQLESCTLPATELKPFDEDRIRCAWGLDRWLDVEGKGIDEKITESSRERYLLREDGKQGYVKLYFESAFDKGMVHNDTRGWLEERVNGQWQRIWTSQSDNWYYRPNILLADIDGDGEDEIVLAVHYRLMAFNKHTGEKIRELKYHKYRNYGQIHAVDLTGDGFCDFVQIVNFPAHLEVILNDGKKFELAWFHDIQYGDIMDSEHIVQTPFYPIADVDNDGSVEIVYSRFNEHGDHRWHTLVLNPLDGHVKFDIPDFVVQDMLPLGHEQQIQMIGVRCDQMFEPKYGGVAIYEIISGEIRLVWQDQVSMWCFWSPYEWENYQSSQWMHGIKQKIATLNKGKSLLLKSQSPVDPTLFVLSLYNFSDGEPVLLSKVNLPDFTILGVRDATDEILLSTRRKLLEFDIHADRFAVRRLGTKSWVDHIAAPVVFQNEYRESFVVVPDLLGSIRCLDYSIKEFPRIRWEHIGHGMEGKKGVCIRREGSEGRNVIFVTSDPQGEAQVVMTNAHGEIEWTMNIDRTHSTVQVGEGGGLLAIQTLPLQEQGYDDIIVTCLKNNMHSGFTIALSGVDARLLWRQDESGAVYVDTSDEDERRGFGGFHPFAGYPKADGTEDLISQFPDLLYIADGHTGQFVVHERSLIGSFYHYDEKAKVLKSEGVLYGIPIIIPQDQKYGKYVVLWGGCTFVSGLWLRTPQGGYFSWFTPYCHSLSQIPLQAVCDFERNGNMQVVGWENATNTITCRNMIEGDLIWQLDLPGANFGKYYIACDIDGDGREECLICTPEYLIAITERNGIGEEVWRMSLPAPCMQPIVADVNGDGYVEILLPCSDGNLYLVE